jgi:multidrug transporter EmrE-like cation transporter
MNEPMKAFILTWGLIFLSALFDSYAAFIVKTKFNEMGHIDFSSFRGFFNYMWAFVKSPLLLSAIVAFVCAPGLWFMALNRVDLSIGYPILVGFHLVFVLAFGVFALNEGMSWNKLIGVLLVGLSLYFFYKK